MNQQEIMRLLPHRDNMLLVDQAEVCPQEGEEQRPTRCKGSYTVTGEGDADIDALVLARGQAKKAKDFAKADQLRDQLKEMGVEVTDVPGGAVWKRM